MRGHYAETYLFRPLEGSGPWLRYAGGLWLPDDGEFDLLQGARRQARA